MSEFVVGNQMACSTLKRHVESQDQFLPRIAHEWRRAERSGKPVILVLLCGLDNLTGEQPRLVEEVCSAFRETDVMGWFESELTFGILCLELGKSSIEEAQKAILTKTTACLEWTAISNADAIRVTVYVLPPSACIEVVDRDTETVAQTIWNSICKPSPVSFAIQRTCDICLSLLLLLMFSPAILVIAVGIRLSSRGPAFYRQIRTGQGGRPFTLYKFRTMGSGSGDSLHQEYARRFISGEAEKQVDENGNSLYKLTRDPRVTRVGKWLRRSSLDEVPQLWNVLRGKMSLVGPRPALPYEVECYDLWHRRRVYELKPGLSGRWQVHGRSLCSFDEMVRLDLEHAAPNFLALYFRTLLETPRAVIFGHGAR